MAPKNLDKIAKIKIAKSSSSTNTTIPEDPIEKIARETRERLKGTATTTTVPAKTAGATTTPTTVVPSKPKDLTPIKAGEKIPNTSSPIIGKNKYGYVTQDNKIIRFENFKPDSSSVIYNPGPKTKTKTTTTKTPPITPPKEYPELTTTQTPEEKTQAAIDATRGQTEAVESLGITETKKKPGGWRGALASVINVDVLGRIPGTNINLPGSFKPVETVVLKPLIVLDTGRRAFVSGFQESVEFAKDIREGKQVYTAVDYIPKHPQTGKPIAKVGEPIIDNVDVILNTPIAIVNNKTLEDLTDKELEAATDKLVNEKGTTSSGNFKDWYKQTKDPTTGFGDIPYIKTGNKWLDRGIGFFGDVALDPTTYATLGGSAVVKPAVAGSKAAVKAAERTAARVALEQAVAAGDRVAIKAAEKAVAVAEKAAISAAPRRLYGAAARENAANVVRQIRDDAAQVAADATKSAAERTVAQKTVNALSDDLIGEIATNGYSVIRGQAAKELGVQSGLRFGFPTFNKAAILPKVTGPFTDAIGKASTFARLGFVNTPVGAQVLKRITPLGAGGLFGSTDILKMRTALRQGTVKGTEAADYVTLLSLDKLYRGQKDLLTKGVGQAVRELTGSKDFRKSAKKLAPYLEIPEGEWAARGLRPLTSAETTVVKDVRDFFDALLDDANNAVKQLGGPGLTRTPNYFPHVQTKETLQWASRNGDKLAKVASNLGIDPTALLQGNFMARNLAVGSNWFGKILTADDISGGVKRLNQIAIDSGEINFKFFAEDLPTVIAQYANNFASFKAYSQTILNAPIEAPNVASFVDQLPTRTKTGIVVRPRIDGLVDVETRILNLMDENKLLNWSVDQIEEVKNRLDDIKSKLAPGSIDRMEFDQAVLDLDEYILAIDRDIASGAITPPMAGLLTHEAENYATALASQIDNVKSTFAVTSPLKWKMVTSMVDDISYPMSRLNPNNIPDIAVKNEVLEMFRNVKRLDDPKFAQLAEVLLKDYTTFLKAYVTSTPGFYLRNAIGNTFMMIATGGNPAYLSKGTKYYASISNQLRKGASLDDAIKTVTKGLPPEEVQFINESLAYAGATGFGQIGEVAAAAGAGKAGIFGKEATGMLPGGGKGIGRVRIPDVKIPGAKTASETLYAPLRGLRNLGAGLEQSNRFALLYDGLKQGYDAQTAASRVNKYLIDYQDLTTLDRNIKQIIPFWMFFSRNLPLQIENMWMNPRAYSLYMNAKRNLEDKEGTSENVPQYLKEQGAFKLPGSDIYLKPDLAFPGAGQPNIIQQFASGDAPQALSMLTSPLRVPLEIRNNSQLFSGAPIKDPKLSDEENAQRMKTYLLNNIIPALGTAGRWLTPLGDKVPKTVRDLTGARLDAELQATLSLIGAPAFKLLESQERSALWRKYFDLKKVIDADIAARRRQARLEEESNK